MKHVRKYMRHVEEELGDQDKPFRIVGMNRRIHFGKQQDLKRSHYLVCIILEWLLKEQPHKAALQATLTLQAMHQAAIDNSWDIAWLLTHGAEDPFKTRLFGGDADALQDVMAYLKSMNELAKSTRPSAGGLRKRGAGRGIRSFADKGKG